MTALAETVTSPAAVGRARRSPRRVADAALLAWLAVAVGVTLLGPLLATEPARTVAAGYQAPGPGLPLGADGLGRDVAQRLLAGGAELLGIAALATVVAVACGAFAGLALTARAGWVRVGALLLDVLLIIPAMLTMMVLIFGLGSGVGTMVCIATVVGVPFVARYTRAIAGPVVRSDYVLHARAAGDPWLRVWACEVAPNLVGPWLADAGVRFVGSVYLIAAAGFLGFAPLGNDVDWATQVQAGLQGIRLNPWASVAPALAIAVVTVPANLLADRGLRRTQR